MTTAFNLRTDIAQPLQVEASQLKAIAKSPAQIAAYNAICDRLEGMHQQLLSTTGTGLTKDWEKL